ncbi:MAG: (deoxy)nucleoside triphosphate pyrophosphohydrolase [Candidatus Sungbacteria bacterium]|nr:(deoxy)nucleoside triphosphate pyrophosphohydrolase [Candidatus Sungbacteria bacterium]
MNSEYVSVTAAIIEDNGRILIAKRPLHKAFPGKWEFPGGKVESSETPEKCLEREIKEEFGVDISIRKSFLVWDYEYDNGKRFRFHSFWCAIAGGEPILLAHDEMRWILPSQLLDQDLLEADIVLAKEIVVQENEKKATG